MIIRSVPEIEKVIDEIRESDAATEEEVAFQCGAVAMFNWLVGASDIKPSEPVIAQMAKRGLA